MIRNELPLFPLNTVLFPDGLLPLRIFERRYLDMIGACMRQGHSFGVVLIREGQEVGTAELSFHPIGVTAQIIDFDTRPDGLLGITSRGGHKFRVTDYRLQPDQLVIGQIEPLVDEPAQGTRPDHAALVTLVKKLAAQMAPSNPDHFQPRWDDAAWVGYRLAEWLPLPLLIKQALLELSDPLQRLDALNIIFERSTSAPG